MVPQSLKPILWDVDLASLDVKKDKDFIIKRVADKGRWDDIVWLKKQYAIDDIIDVVKKSKNISKKTKNFWLTYV